MCEEFFNSFFGYASFSIVAKKTSFGEDECMQGRST